MCVFTDAGIASQAYRGASYLVLIIQITIIVIILV